MYAWQLDRYQHRPEGSLIVMPPDLSSCLSRLFLNLPLRLSGIGLVGIRVCWRIIMLISRSIRSSSLMRSCSSRRSSSCSWAFCWFSSLFSSSSRRFNSYQTDATTNAMKKLQTTFCANWWLYTINKCLT